MISTVVFLIVFSLTQLKIIFHLHVRFAVSWTQQFHYRVPEPYFQRSEFFSFVFCFRGLKIESKFTFPYYPHVLKAHLSFEVSQRVIVSDTSEYPSIDRSRRQAQNKIRRGKKAGVKLHSTQNNSTSSSSSLMLVRLFTVHCLPEMFRCLEQRSKLWPSGRISTA